MSNSGEENVRVFENGWDGNKYEYNIDTKTEPATVTVRVCPPHYQSSVNSSFESDDVSDESCENQKKRRKLDDVSNSGTVKNPTPNHKQACLGARGNENFCTEGSDVEGEENEHAVDSSGSRSNPSHVERAHCNENESAISSSTGIWTHDLENFPITVCFTGETGLHLNKEEDFSALSCFRLFFTDWLLRHLKEQTNKAANDLRAANIEDLDRDGKNMLKDWTSVSLTDIKGFILVLIHMGVVKKKSFDDYWCQDVFLASPFATQILNRERFRSIMNMLQMNDNHNYIPVSHPDHDPLYKIRPVYDHLQEKFQEVYTPSKNITLDGAAYFDSSSLSSPFQREHCNLQLCSKSDKSGLRLYKLCDSQTGYVFNFEFCSSSSDIDVNNSKNINSHEQTKEVALRMMSPLLHKGYHVYTDTKFTCPALYKTLADKNTMCTGAVSGNVDGMPDDLVDEDLLMKGQIAFRRKDKLCAVKWNPNINDRNDGDIFILTSAHHPLETSTKKESGKNRNAVTAASSGNPVCVNDYDKNMSTVEESIDQTTAYTPLAQQPMKWWKRILFHFLVISVKQSMIVYNKLQGEKDIKKTLTLSLFVKALGKQLTDEYIAERNQPTKSLYVASLTGRPNPLLRTDHSHFHHLVKIPKDPLMSKKPRRTCRVCSDVLSRIRASCPSSVRSRHTTPTRCAVCLVTLCFEPCFYIFHNEGDYVSVGAAMDHYLSMAAGCNNGAIADNEDS